MQEKQGNRSSILRFYIFQKSEGHFFDQVTEDVKIVFTISMWPLLAELKFKVAEFAVLLISALPLEVTFQM